MLAGLHIMEINCQSGDVNATCDKMLKIQLCGQKFVLRLLLGSDAGDLCVGLGELSEL